MFVPFQVVHVTICHSACPEEFTQWKTKNIVSLPQGSSPRPPRAFWRHKRVVAFLTRDNNIMKVDSLFIYSILMVMICSWYVFMMIFLSSWIPKLFMTQVCHISESCGQVQEKATPILKDRFLGETKTIWQDCLLSTQQLEKDRTLHTSELQSFKLKLFLSKRRKKEKERFR